MKNNQKKDYDQKKNKNKRNFRITARITTRRRNFFINT